MDLPPPPKGERKLRLAVIGARGLPADLPEAGGGERVTEESCTRLVLRGYEVTVYCRRHYNRRPSTPYKGIHLVSLPSIPTKNLDNITHSLLATLHVAFANTADIIQFSGSGTALMVPLAKLLGKKTVVGIDGVDWERPKWGPLARFALRLGAKTAFRLADAVHVDNAVAQRRFGELFGRYPELITLGATACGKPGTDLLAEFELEPNGYVLFVGLLKPDKGVHVLVEAYRAVETTLPLVIVGDSPDSGHYVRDLKRTTDERIRFLGYRYGPQVQQLFSNCLLYVQPSLMEGNSPALMTAMACGRGVVVSDIEQNIETIGSAGATFASEDSGSLARVLTDLMHDPQELERMGGMARARVEAIYDWDVVVDQLDRLYRSLWPKEVLPRAASGSPLELAIDFWKPKMEPDELRALARYCSPDEPPSPGINAFRAGSQAHHYRVVAGENQFSLFAAVHPIADAPESAVILADIVDRSGVHYSYVLRFPGDGSIVVPFDPNAAIESFRREEYVLPGKRTVLPMPLMSLYYVFKPLVPRGVRMRMRRRMARRTRASEHFVEWPTDQSMDMLQRLLLSLMLIASDRQDLQFAWFWPNRHPWAAVLTHDVDSERGLARISHIAEIERQRGLRSSFNLVPLDYEVQETVLRSLREDGFEIGVHGYRHDGMLFSKWSTFLRRIVTINEYGRQWNASGFRSPATYRNAEWFHMLGFEYDSSVTDTAPFEPQPGGCASLFPYPIGDLIELPMTLAQDHTLFGLLEERDGEIWSTKLQQIRDANGMACMLTHPDPDWGYVGLPENEVHYAKVLDDLAASDAWVPLPRDLARWWRTRATTPPGRIDGVEGMSLGTAVLHLSGRVEIIPPAR